MPKKRILQGVETYTRTPTRSYIRNSDTWQERPMSGSGPITERAAIERKVVRPLRTLTQKKRKKKPLGAMSSYLKRRDEALAYE